MNQSLEAPAPLSVPSRLRVLIVDGQREPGPSLRALLEGHPNLTIVDERDSIGDTADFAELRPDIAVMHLTDAPSIDVCRSIRAAYPEVRVLVMAAVVEAETLFATIAAGASGYLSRDATPEELQDAVVTIASGGSVLDPLMATAVFERLREDSLDHPADDAFATLSPQEERILDMIAEGMTNGEIAAALSLSQKTIKNYASQIYAKLNVARRSQAARLATERRMLKQR